MSKLSFRAKALDPGKPMPVYIGDEIPDLPDVFAVNRTVPEMPTGMEKEEETEHHLQRALSAQQVYGTAESLVIPIPDMDIIEDRYRKLYCNSTTFKLPKQYIHVQPWGMDQEIPEYDMDSEDEQFLSHQVKKLKMEVKPVKFENMMDRLDKGSGQMVVTLSEAKALLKEDDDLTIAVYDYWLNKRLRLQHSLIPQVKTEKRDGSSTNNPYVAFRRRAEKMQTRKNRKNDESSYEKMLKLRKDLSRALLILEMLKRREKSKKEMLKLTIEVAEKRYQLQDWDGKHLEEANSKKDLLPVFQPVPLHISTKREWTMVAKPDGTNVHKKREYKKRKHKNAASTQVERILKQQQQPKPLPLARPSFFVDDDRLAPGIGSDDDGLLSGSSPSDGEGDPDGVFAFRRKHGCAYHAPCHFGIGQWPWGSREQSGFGDKKYKYSLASLDQLSCLGYARRRVGRGGRVMFDRAFTQWDKSLRNVDWSSQNSSFTSDYNDHLRTHNIPHFQPTSCHPNASSPRAVDSSESFPCQPVGFSAAGASRSNDTVHHRDHPYFAATACDLDHRYHPSSDDSSSFPPLNCPTEAATAIASLQVGRNAFSSNAGLLSAASLPGHCSQESTQRPTKFPAVPAASHTNCDDVGLSTLPAANILQLNFPLTSSLRQANSFLNESGASVPAPPLPAARNSVPTSSANHCRIVKPTISVATAVVNVQHVANNAQKNAACPRPELSLNANHVNLSALTTSSMSFAASSAVMPSTILNNLVPVLKLPGTAAKRNDNKPKDPPRESLNHVAKESVVGVEVT